MAWLRFVICVKTMLCSREKGLVWCKYPVNAFYNSSRKAGKCWYSEIILPPTPTLLSKMHAHTHTHTTCTHTRTNKKPHMDTYMTIDRCSLNILVLFLQKKPVIQMKAASALNRIIVLCDLNILLLNMLDLEVRQCLQYSQNNWTLIR